MENDRSFLQDPVNKLDAFKKKYRIGEGEEGALGSGDRYKGREKYFQELILCASSKDFKDDNSNKITGNNFGDGSFPGQSTYPTAKRYKKDGKVVIVLGFPTEEEEKLIAEYTK